MKFVQLKDIDGNPATVGECDHCGRKTQLYARNMGDPYTAELYPEEDAGCSNWCELCWDNRKGDI